MTFLAFRARTKDRIHCSLRQMKTYFKQLPNGRKSINEMKALGVTFTSDLRKAKYVNKIVGKSYLIINKIKFQRIWIDQRSVVKIVTSQFFGALYDTTPIRFNNFLETLRQHTL